MQTEACFQLLFSAGTKSQPEQEAAKRSPSGATEVPTLVLIHPDRVHSDSGASEQDMSNASEQDLFQLHFPTTPIAEGLNSDQAADANERAKTGVEGVHVRQSSGSKLKLPGWREISGTMRHHTIACYDRSSMWRRCSIVCKCVFKTLCRQLEERKNVKSCLTL
jgi:hypothetical protein